MLQFVTFFHLVRSPQTNFRPLRLTAKCKGPQRRIALGPCCGGWRHSFSVTSKFLFQPVDSLFAFLLRGIEGFAGLISRSAGFLCKIGNSNLLASFIVKLPKSSQKCPRVFAVLVL